MTSISTWLLIITLQGYGSATPAQTFLISDIPDKAECQRTGMEISNRFDVKKSLCVEVRKVKT